MYSINKPGIHEEIIKKSRFISEVISLSSESGVIQHLRQLHGQHPHANHIVYAYKIITEKGIISRFHDAGEPSGTAGKPVYQHIEGKNLINVLITVIRYFGGIKLGAGGLTRAYSNTAKKALESVEIVPFTEYKTIRLRVDYKDIQMVKYHLKKFDGKILQQAFSENVDLTISLPDKNLISFMSVIPNNHPV
jgi:uncharacterized YigZ family protein